MKRYKIIKCIVLIFGLYSILSIIYIINNYPKSEWFWKIQYEIRPFILCGLCYLLIRNDKNKKVNIIILPTGPIILLVKF